MNKAIVLFDGFCKFCSWSVNFIIDHDPQGYFLFVPLQDTKGAELLAQFGLGQQAIDTLILLEEGKLYTHSTAVLRIARNLRGPSKLLYALVIIPPPVRDLFYKLFARYRYKIFGKTLNCRVPTDSERQRFIG